ncbi:MAG: VIT1/CCC1 transporter family protein [Calditrichia bacterium]
MEIDKTTLRELLVIQKNEITEALVYEKIISRTTDEKNKKILEKIAREEHGHYQYLKSITRKEVPPNRWKVFFYAFVTMIFGLSFGLKLMEKGEEIAQEIYSALDGKIEGMNKLLLDEQEHEDALLNMLEEERLEYAGSMVLGLNDALVELTGALAGLTLALQNNKLIALAGMITGFAASLSMAASGYLSSKEEAELNDVKNPVKAALYTGTAYILTVIILILPYFLVENVFMALGLTLVFAVLVIFLYTFYITTAKGQSFWNRFLEMAIISLSIAAISFGAGLVLKKFFNIDI